MARRGFMDYAGAASNPISKHYYESKWAGEDAELAGEIQAEYAQKALDAGQAGYEDVQGMFDPYSQAGLTALGQIQEGDFTTDMGQFEYGKDVNDFLDPSMEFQQEQMAKNMQQNAIARGSYASGGFDKALQDRGAQVAQGYYGQARQDMANDKATSYQQFRDQFASRRANNQQRFSQLQGLNQMGFDANRGMSNARMQQAQGQAQGYNQLGQAQALADTGYSTAMNQGFQNATDPNRIAGIAGSVMKMGG
tara:strand:+ start:5640 stop:6392 length:753 start_codon:yes stop_codon:yes gene_type:complete